MPDALSLDSRNQQICKAIVQQNRQKVSKQTRGKTLFIIVYTLYVTVLTNELILNQI